MRARMFVLVTAVAASASLAGCLTGCKKRPSYDRSSPEKTLESFFAALDKGRIPKDLDRFVLDPQERQLWSFRCRQRGCTGGQFEVRDVPELSAYRATLLVDYTVTGEGGGVVMRGERSPIKLERDGDAWLLVRFGRRLTAGDSGASGTAPNEDAGAPSKDAGGDAHDGGAAADEDESD